MSPCSCPPRGPQLFHSQVNFTLKNMLAKALSTFTRKSAHSQDHACKCTFDKLKSHLTSQECACKFTGDFHSEGNFTFQERACHNTLDFHSQVNSLSRSCLQMHFWLSLKSHLTSQERACKCTGDFHSHVTSQLSSSHSGRLATVARLSFVAQSSCSCELDTAIRCHTSCCARRPLWVWFCSWRSHPALASIILPSGSTHPAVQDAHCGLGFALWCSIFSDTATRPI